MTAFNFIFDENQVIICMDTLSLNERRKPFKFVSKMFTIPHLRSVICGTGNLDLILEWVNRVQRNVVASDIVFLNSIATKSLQELNSKYPKEVTSTIYQFGYSMLEEKLLGSVYRSNMDFQKEDYPYCSAIKPQVDFDLYEEVQSSSLDEALIKLVSKQKTEDEKSTEPVGIGGDIHRLYMNKNTYHLDIIHRFSDHEQCYDKMLQNLNE